MRTPSGGSSAARDPLKYAPGSGPSLRPEPLSPLEWLALAHAGTFYLWLTWAFGGGAESMRPYLAWWGTMGVLLTFTALQDRASWKQGWMRPLLWLWPLAAFNALVLLSSFNPSFQEVRFENEILLAGRESVAWLPSSARPQLALQALWLFDAVWIPAFNLALIVRQRRALRGLLLLIVANAFLIAVFGTVQKLWGATGIFFGKVVTPQAYFFGTFIYHNHWGAFILLILSICLGLLWHYARRHDGRNALHSPAFLGLVGIFFLAATLPLSGSRSSTLLGGALLGGAFLHWVTRFVRSRRHYKESVVLPLAAALATLLLAGGGIWYLARDMIEKRAALTRQQVSVMVAEGDIGSRADLYRDTWRMAKDKPWFGWGMASYPHVFHANYNRQKSVDRLPVFYRDAHSDWLQAFAEHGAIGTILLALCAVVPLARVRWYHLQSPIPAYLLAGCGLLLVYAWVEFPFGNIAVVFLWWLACFSAVQYSRLQDRESTAAARPTAADVP